MRLRDFFFGNIRIILSWEAESKYKDLSSIKRLSFTSDLMNGILIYDSPPYICGKRLTAEVISISFH